MFYEEKGMAYCGLACVLCKEADCPGCKLSGCPNQANCTIYRCCSEKGIAGCYQCNRFPCQEKLFESIRLKAFNLYAREKGVQTLLGRLKQNYSDGIVYHKDGGLKGDYDSFENEDDIFSFIDKGIYVNPYGYCPSFQTENLLIRPVKEDDAADLLACYSDPIAQKYFNSDNCTNCFQYQTIEEMLECIRFWLNAYKAGAFVRWSIVDLKTEKGIGTIEMFGTKDAYGILRMDLASSYEKCSYISEILTLAEEHFHTLFHVDDIITKAVPEAVERNRALTEFGYKSLEKSKSRGFEHYYVLGRKTVD